MKLIAQRGKSVFIVEDKNEEGWIYSLETGTLSRKGPIQSFLKFGYWERPTEENNQVLQEVAKLVKSASI